MQMVRIWPHQRAAWTGFDYHAGCPDTAGQQPQLCSFLWGSLLINLCSVLADLAKHDLHGQAGAGSFESMLLGVTVALSF